MTAPSCKKGARPGPSERLAPAARSLFPSHPARTPGTEKRPKQRQIADGA